MDYRTYCIWDKVAEEIVNNTLVLQRNDAQAVRMFTEVVTQKDQNGQPSKFAQHADDFELIDIGIILIESPARPIMATGEGARVVITAKQVIEAQLPPARGSLGVDL